jgi:hypothetical protein
MGGAQGNISPAVCIATGDGNFKFSYAGFSFFSSNPAIGDFNNDGKLDFFSADSSTGSTFLGNGDGTFQGPLAPADSGNAATGDVNHDGNLDVVLVNGDIWHGNGDGTFTAATPLANTNGIDLALQDTQGTNQLDIAMLTGTSLLIYPAFSGGKYSPAISFPVSVLGTYGANLGVGDFNNDGRVDFVVPGATLPLKSSFRHASASRPLVLATALCPWETVRF